MTQPTLIFAETGEGEKKKRRAFFVQRKKKNSTRNSRSPGSLPPDCRAKERPCSSGAKVPLKTRDAALRPEEAGAHWMRRHYNPSYHTEEQASQCACALHITPSEAAQNSSGICREAERSAFSRLFRFMFEVKDGERRRDRRCE